MRERNRIIITGGGAAGMSAATAARRVDDQCEIIVFERGGAVAYAHCGLPYLISGLVQDYHDLFVYPLNHFIEERNIKVHLHTEASALDHRKRVVTVCNKKEKTIHEVGYDSLIIATGAFPVTPSFARPGLRNFFVLRTLDDALHLKGFLSMNSPEKAVILGGGLIGTLMAEALAVRGINVSIVEKRDGILPEFESEIALYAEDMLRARGISLITGVTPSGFEIQDDRILAVKADRYSFDADIVVSALGIHPETSLFSEFSESAGTLITDDRMATPVNGIFSCGDCTSAYHNIAGKRLYRPLGTTANRQGRVAGENAAGHHSLFTGIVGTQALKLFDLEMARTGLSSEEARQFGIRTVDVTTVSPSVAGYIPGSHPITTRVLAESGSGRVVGAQMAGCGEVAKRMDVFVSIIQNRMRVSDALNLDLSYTPRCSPLWDPVLYCLREMLKKLSR